MGWLLCLSRKTLVIRQPSPSLMGRAPVGPTIFAYAAIIESR